MNKVLKTIIVSVILITTANTYAGSTSSLMRVKANVMSIAKYTISHQENNLTITQADIDRGFLDVDDAMILSIKTNSVNGYLLVVSVSSGSFKGLRVWDGNNAYSLAESGGEVHMPFQGTNFVTKKLGFRFHLLKNTKPGIYHWPVTLAIQAM